MVERAEIWKICSYVVVRCRERGRRRLWQAVAVLVAVVIG